MLSSLMGPSLYSPVSWDKQALPATQRKDRQRERIQVASYTYCDSGGGGVRPEQNDSKKRWASSLAPSTRQSAEDEYMWRGGDCGRDLFVPNYLLLPSKLPRQVSFSLIHLIPFFPHIQQKKMPC